ncbi:cadherin-7-like [Ruditapes philippinarum]|uniref:cadherin-7-like n=1 Tax=Ruditapes philippinarum TaxID=129788 RepID=UPI00295C21B3|nr:cadherin-7-like [Ruditapes philippinarum]
MDGYLRQFIEWPTINEWQNLRGNWPKIVPAAGAIDGKQAMRFTDQKSTSNSNANAARALRRTKPEDTAVDATIATFTATPTSPDTIASYELLTADTPFKISSPGGLLTLTSALDFETKSSYVIEVKATDNNASPNSGIATLTITVTDVNEAPEFGQASYTVCVTDGSAADTSVATFSASDQDATNTITYSITGDANDDFKISTAELQVNTGKTLNTSRTAKYTLVIHATDNGSPVQTGTSTYTINVQASCNGATALTVTLMTLLLALIVSLN